MTSSDSLFSVVVPAAGVGSRMQANCPKQYLPLCNTTLLEQTLQALLSHPAIGHIYLALHQDDPYYPELSISNDPRITKVIGGKERADSVLNGLKAMSGQEDWVLVHDAARPCVNHTDINHLLALSKSTHGGILATKVRDTMKRSNEHNTVLHTEERENLWHALTPQFFPYSQLLNALDNALAQGVAITDEASAMEWAGHQVHLIEGDDRNIKVTRPQDLPLAEFYLQNNRSTSQ